MLRKLPARTNVLSLFLLFLFVEVLVLLRLIVDPGKFERIYANYFKLRTALFTGNHVAFFNFIQFNIQIDECLRYNIVLAGTNVIAALPRSSDYSNPKMSPKARLS